MKRILVIVIVFFMIIIAGNFLYYKGLYKTQIDYRTKLLGRQAGIVGMTIDSINNGFASDLNKIIFSEDISLFFSDQESRIRIVDRMKIFFSKYGNLVTGIKLYDNNKNEFTLKKDETGINWLEHNFVLRMQGDIIQKEILDQADRNYEYYLPVIRSGIPEGNLVVTLDFQKFFREILNPFNYHEFQWQWVISDSGKIIFDNNPHRIEYSGISRITAELGKGIAGDIRHNVSVDKVDEEIISSYYSTQFLKKEFGLVFSTATGNIRKYIIRNSILLGIGTLVLLSIVVFIFVRNIRFLKSEVVRLDSSEKMLLRMIEEMPVGVIIHNKNSEIIKANRMAAQQYSYTSESEMTGKIFSGPSVADQGNYFSRNLSSYFRPDQFIVIKKEIGEIVLFRTSIPVRYLGQEATMEMLMDVTMLETARMDEVKASTAKTEFLARMNYELRTPLNGIIGMADILDKQKLTPDAKNVLGLLRRSAEILLNIINDILDFSKIESGKMMLDEIPFNFREEIVYCYDLARTGIDEEDIRLTCNVDDNVPDKVIGDPFRLRQILTNFLNHSIRSTSKGQINLTCRLLGNENGIVHLGFELVDTGRNYDNASLKKIFGDYVNIESKIHTEDDSSGFGTILARQLVELMGGEFSAESLSGINGDSGTKIRFSIKLGSNENPSKNLYFEDIVNFSQIRALVVTGCQTRDEEILGSLHKLGVQLTVTTYQKSTVSQIKTNLKFPENRYHMIVILNDREFNGFIAAQDLRDNDLSGQLVMMVISSEDTKGNLVRANSLGIDHYIVKPFEIKELFDAVKSSFQGLDTLVPAGESEKTRNDLRILVVEDNKMNQKVIGTMLKSLGYSIDFADNGFEGLILAKTRRYDVIFMDLIMPEMDGFESSRRILEYDSSLLIVAFTADNMPDSRRKAELSGIREFIPKPVRIDDLKKFFTRYLAQNIKSVAEN